MSILDNILNKFRFSDDMKAEREEFEKIKTSSQEKDEEIKVDVKEDEETPTIQEITEVIEKSKEDDETKAKVDKALKALTSLSSSNKSQVLKGQNLMGSPSSMSPFGPLAKSQTSPSPLFAGLDTYFGGKLKSIEGQLDALRKALKKGANV